MYSTVPTKVSARFPSLAEPKSAILQMPGVQPCVSSKRFRGLMSRWITPFWWRNDNPSATHAACIFTEASWPQSCKRLYAIVRSSRHSMIRTVVAEVTVWPKYFTTNGLSPHISRALRSTAMDPSIFRTWRILWSMLLRAKRLPPSLWYVTRPKAPVPKMAPFWSSLSEPVRSTIALVKAAMPTTAQVTAAAGAQNGAVPVATVAAVVTAAVAVAVEAAAETLADAPML